MAKADRKPSLITNVIEQFMRVLGQKTHQEYKYSFVDSIVYGLCICCPRKYGNKQRTRHRIFITSYDKLLEEMDVVEFIRNMRYLKVLLKMLFTHREHQIVWRLRSINLHE
jgi:hypothetical protein